MAGFMSVNGLGSARDIGSVFPGVKVARIRGYRATVPGCSATPL